MPFLLLGIGIILTIINIKALKKDDNSFSNMLKYKEYNLTDVELQVGAVRQDMAESILELQQEILELRNEIKALTNVEEIEVINEIKEKSRTDLINELIEIGLSDDEICERLSIGKGEVLLVRNLFKK